MCRADSLAVRDRQYPNMKEPNQPDGSTELSVHELIADNRLRAAQTCTEKPKSGNNGLPLFDWADSWGAAFDALARAFERESYLGVHHGLHG
jgi:hypothetical protein